MQYRGRCTDDYARALHKAQAPCTVVMTLRKLKTVLPSLKEPVEKMFKSGVVYKIVCPSCTASYVGETTRHLQVRFTEHVQRAGPMKSHLSKCNTTLSEQDIGFCCNQVCLISNLWLNFSGILQTYHCIGKQLANKKGKKH